MPATRLRRSLLRALVAVAALSMGACSSSDGDDGASPAVTVTVAGTGSSVTSDDGSFRAEFPIQPERSEATETAAGIDLLIVTYVAEIDNGAVGVSYSDYPGVPENPQDVLDGAAEGSATRIKGTITSSAPTRFLDRDAQDVEIAVDGGAVFERIVLDGARLYVILGAAEKGRPAAYDRLLDTFELL